MQAIEVITDAYRRCNRLSPGETLNADDAAMAFTALNLLVDDLSAKRQFLYRSVITEAAQTGSITLGATSWINIVPGEMINSVAVNGELIPPLTATQRSSLPSAAPAGLPQYYIYNGFATIDFYPSPTGQTVRLETGAGTAKFADQSTNYIVPPGYQNALGAMLAVKIAPSIISQLPPYLAVQAGIAMRSINRYAPGILDVVSFNNDRRAPRGLF